MTKFQLFVMLTAKKNRPVTIRSSYDGQDHTGHFQGVDRIHNEFPGNAFIVKLWQPNQTTGIGGKTKEIYVITID